MVAAHASSRATLGLRMRRHFLGYGVHEGTVTALKGKRFEVTFDDGCAPRRTLGVSRLLPLADARARACVCSHSRAIPHLLPRRVCVCVLYSHTIPPTSCPQ